MEIVESAVHRIAIPNTNMAVRHDAINCSMGRWSYRLEEMADTDRQHSALDLTEMPESTAARP